MIESYLQEGSRDVARKVFRKSITDPCLGWEEPRALVPEIAESV